MYLNYSTHTPYPKPYALMDLDDTLFQTKRKLTHPYPDDKLIIASVDKQNHPLSFLTPKQSAFFYWLNQTTVLIPVTARDDKEIKRVQLPFFDHKVLTHGAIILDKNNQIDQKWSNIIQKKLIHHQTKLSALPKILAQIYPDQDLNITFHQHDFFGKNLLIYLAIKHQQKNHDILKKLGEQLSALLHPDFYIHQNANNLAILPPFIHKKHAVKFLLEQIIHPETPVFGFGDSLADLPFLALLDWYGTPNSGQLHTSFMEKFL